MADNVVLNAGSGGDTIASDDIGGVKHQRVKLSVGADGTAVDAIPVSNGLDTTATGVPAVGIVGQFDDASVGAVTENQFAPVRISTRRALLVEGVASGTAVPVSQSGTWDEVGINDSGNSITVDNAQLSVVGSGTEAAAMRVTLATDSTGVLSVDDNGGALTVDGTVAVTGVSTVAEQQTQTTHLATIAGDTTAIETAVQLIDDAVYAEDIAAQAADKGIAVLAVRRDADTTLVGADNDYANLQVDANGYLKVEIFDGGGSHTVDGTVTANAGTNLNTSALALEAGNLATIAGDTTAIETAVQIMDDWDETDRAKVNTIAGQVGVQGASGVVTALTQRVVLATDVALPAGTNGIGKLTANSGVDIGDVDVLSLVTGTGATNLGKAEDAAHTTGDVGVMMLGVRAAAPTERSAGPTDGDYEPIGINEVGAQWTTPTPSANGGLTIFRSLDLDESEEEVKATAGVVYGCWVTNTATATRWLKFYNATAANVTVGSTTPVITIGIPGNSADDISANFGPGGMGIGFATAITVAATTGVADADTGAPAANDVIVNVFYK